MAASQEYRDMTDAVSALKKNRDPQKKEALTKNFWDAAVAWWNSDGPGIIVLSEHEQPTIISKR